MALGTRLPKNAKVVKPRTTGNLASALAPDELANTSLALDAAKRMGIPVNPSSGILGGLNPAYATPYQFPAQQLGLPSPMQGPVQPGGGPMNATATNEVLQPTFAANAQGVVSRPGTPYAIMNPGAPTQGPGMPSNIELYKGGVPQSTNTLGNVINATSREVPNAGTIDLAPYTLGEDALQAAKVPNAGTIDLAPYTLGEDALQAAKAGGGSWLNRAGQALSVGGGKGGVIGKALTNAGTEDAVGLFAKGGLARGLGGAAMAGLTTNQLIDMATAQFFGGGENPKGVWDEILSGAAAGGTTGGIAAGPWGALAGAVLGGGAAWLKGDDHGAAERAQAKAVADLQPKIAEQNANAMQYLLSLGISQEDANKAIQQVGFFTQNATNEADLKTIYQQIVPALGDDLKNRVQNQARQAAIQTYLLPQFTRFMDTAQAQANAYGEASQNAAATFNDPNLQAIYKANAQSIPAYQSQLNAAYAAQISALGAQGRDQANQLTYDDNYFKALGLAAGKNAATTGTGTNPLAQG